MTTSRKPMTGRAQSDYSSKLDAYNKESKRKAVGTFMRTFSRSKKSKLITAWDDADYVLVLDNYFYWLADVSGAVDSETAGSAQALAILDKTWELFYTNANLKDLVAGEEASWKLYFCAAAFICCAIQIQYNFRCYLPAYTEADGTPGGSSNIPYFSQSSFDIFCASMKDLPIPKGVYELVDIFLTWVVKLANEYESNTLKIPGCYLFPFNDHYDLEDLEAARNLMKTNWGNAITHAQKFGMKMGKWRDPVKPNAKTLSDPDVIAFFNHAHIKYYDNQPANVELYPSGGYIGTNLTTNYTAVEFCFIDNPNESKIHVLAPFFGTYDGTNNPYGGLILTGDTGGSEYYISSLHVAQHGNNIQPNYFSSGISGKVVMELHKCVKDNYLQDGGFNTVITGDNFTADQGLDESWLLEAANQLFYGTGRGATETNDDLLNFLGRSMI